MRLAAALLLLPLAAAGEPAEDRLRAIADRERQDRKVPLIAIALARAEVVTTVLSGAEAAHDLIRAGPATRLVTALAAQRLVETGSLALDAPVAPHLPELGSIGARVTPRQLLDDVAGFPLEPPAGSSLSAETPPLAAVVSSLRDQIPRRTPRRSGPSLAGYAALGLLLERVAGESFEALAHRLVFQPLGMARSNFRVDGQLAKHVVWTYDGREIPPPQGDVGPSPAAGLVAPIEDLGRLAARLARAPVRGVQRGSLDGHGWIGQSGWLHGFTTSIRALPGEGIGVAVVATRHAAAGLTEALADHALRLLLAERGRRPPPEPPTFGEAEASGAGTKAPAGTGSAAAAAALTAAARTSLRPEWAGLLGEYGWPHQTAIVLEREGRLELLVDWTAYLGLERDEGHTYRVKGPGLWTGTPVRFVRDRAAPAVALELGGIRMPRRPEAEGATFRISPARPVAELVEEALAARPPDEAGDFLPSDLVELVTLDPTIRLDVRYAGSDNFLGTPVYREARAFLQRPAAEALLRAHRALAARGYGILVHDGYRPWYVTKVFWDATPEEGKIFVADPAKGSRHNRGCAVDVTLYELRSGKPVVMPGLYDEMTPRSFPDYPGGTTAQRARRELLRRAMEAEGFTVYESEWWHFDYRDWRRYRIGTRRFDELQPSARPVDLAAPGS